MKKYKITKAFGTYAAETIVQFSKNEAEKYKGFIIPLDGKKPEIQENKKAEYSSKK